MKKTTIPVLAIFLLILAGCDERVSNKSTEIATSAVPAVAVKELTLEEKFLKTQNKAEAGDAEAQSNLGWMYYKGDGVTKNFTLALELLQKASSQGEASAHHRLGRMYYSGNGVTKDLGKAMDFYVKAADQSFAPAMSDIGSLYFYGSGVKKDINKAIEWHEKAATIGDAQQKFMLGNYYLLGIGVSQSAAKAFEWYQQAAKANNVDAYFSLGSMYANGQGIPKNYVKALEWYQKSAALGNDDAQAELGFIYLNGTGTNKNHVLAYAWLNIASASKAGTNNSHVINDIHGMSDYNDKKDKRRAFLRDVLEPLLTPIQLDEAQHLASNWKNGDILVASNDSASVSTTRDGKPTKHSTGTAFTVSNEGYALTNHHVINGCSNVKIAGREGTVKVITSDSVNDLALLQLQGKANDIATLNPDLGKLRQGDDIIVFGYPLNWVLSSGGNLTPGTISALTGLGNNTNQIQITAPIQPGSSGSPVMDKKGNVVGVVSMKLSDTKMVKSTGTVGQNVNFAVNGQTVKSFLDANKVPYKTGGGFFSREKSNADIAEEARKSTMLVECWK